MQKIHKINKKIPKKKNSIFNYDEEMKENKSKPRKKLTRKIKDSEKKINDEFIIGENVLPKNKKEIKELKKNKKKIKEIQKRKIKETEKKRKEIIKKQKQENKIQNKKIKKKLNTKQIIKIKRRRKILKNIFLTLIIVTAIVLFLLSPIFNIKEIVILGNEKISTIEITNLLNIENNTNIFKEKKENMINKIKENPYIDSVYINKKLPSTIEVTVKERTIEYQIQNGGAFVYINSEGYILEISTNKLQDKIKILGYVTSQESIKPGLRLCDEDLQKLNVVNQIVFNARSTNISDIITSINIENDNNFSMYFESEGKTAYLGDSNNLKTKMLYIKEIIEREKGKDGEIFVNRDINNKKSYFKEKV